MRLLKKRCPDVLGTEGLGVSPSFNIPPRLGDTRGLNKSFSALSFNSMSTYGVILFHTTSYALRAEKKLVKEGFSVKLVPTPREFSSDCGVALRFEYSELERVTKLLNSAFVEIASIHQM